MADLVYNTDNGIIALALAMYIKTASELGGEQRLIDRASELEFVFKNKPDSQRYDWPDYE